MRAAVKTAPEWHGEQPETETADSRAFCAYCGDLADTIDHVTPYSWNNTKIRKCAAGAKGSGPKVPACRECNMLLGARPLFNVKDRAAFLYEAVQSRHRGLLKAPNWRRDELAELAPTLRQSVEADLRRRSIVLDRIENLYRTASR